MVQNYASGVSEAQIRLFKGFGYLVLPQFFTPEEMQVLSREVEQTMALQYVHKPFDGSKRHWTMMLDEETPFHAGLLEDPRFLTLARQLYGDDVLGVGIDANRYVGNTGWHPDTASLLQYGIKFAFYLQPVGPDSGALRVIPGSHRFDLNDPFWGPAVRALPLEEVPATALSAQPGDVIGFDLRTWHASYGGGIDRRMGTVVYYNNPKTPEEVEYVRRQGEGNVNAAINSFEPQRRFLYSRSWLTNPQKSPWRRAWIERLATVGYFDAPNVVEGGWPLAEQRV
ncbi:MAG: phytanoyl-CoA dioxygenase family protein [Candidatus Handelsmanbacteria bacterium]|nr:phytanoyl-CoA dioxygenase family protein [Candidatus Handelsmanbacteria bacterium]